MEKGSATSDIMPFVVARHASKVVFPSVEQEAELSTKGLGLSASSPITISINSFPEQTSRIMHRLGRGAIRSRSSTMILRRFFPRGLQQVIVKILIFDRYISGRRNDEIGHFVGSKPLRTFLCAERH